MIEGKIFECPACGSEEYYRCEHECGTKTCVRCSCEYHYFENRITRGHKPICGVNLPSIRSDNRANYADQYDDEDLPELVARDGDEPEDEDKKEEKKEEKKQASVEEQNRWDNGPDDDYDDPDELQDLPDESDEKINYEGDIPTVEEVEAAERSIVTTRRS